jgi:phage-related baseplate assembly protein
MPAKYGVISKAYIEQTKVANLQPGEIPSTLDLYVLTFNRNKQLVNASNALKQNLNTYLSQYRIIGDSVRIKDAFVINIGVNFDITVAPNYNSNEVILAAITAVKEYFNVNNWQINQPILLKNLSLLIDNVDGVQTVKNVEVVNLTGESLGYSNYSYDTKGATIDNVVYPSIDPMIFEVKYPDVDIKGRVVSL